MIATGRRRLMIAGRRRASLGPSLSASLAAPRGKHPKAAHAKAAVGKRKHDTA